MRACVRARVCALSYRREAQLTSISLSLGTL